eukprot:TRINITY_DN46255_c0_g1_i1.p1 TRINITY_DN46255_c0_g1~~TRINITY_DN46255_c0_g1_i1.p1  ORF type:complete len:383 (+),score=70.37 TRINITY_DN46255_c0_g1_i1:85-1233(+)
MAETASSAKRRRRAKGAINVPELLGKLPCDLATPRGEPLNVLFLRFLGGQALAACCKSMLDWLTLGGQRLILLLNEECRPMRGPFIPLERVAVKHVEYLRLGRYGRKTVADYVEVIAACANAFLLRCVYAQLEGMAAHMAMTLHLRRARFHQCRLLPGDLAKLLTCAPKLEVLDVFGENMKDLGPALKSSPPTCQLKAFELTDCALSTIDAAVFFHCFKESAKSAHIQASSLRGLRLPKLPLLESLSLLDCRILRPDAAAIMAACPKLRVLRLCGNYLGLGPDDMEPDEDAEQPTRGELDMPTSDAESEMSSWPKMNALVQGDFRGCGLDSDDELSLRACVPDGASVDVKRQSILRAGSEGGGDQGAARGAQHIVFESSDED